MSKYIIEVDDNTVANGYYPIIGTNNVLVSPDGLDKLQKYEDEQPFPQLGDKYWVFDSAGYVGSYDYCDIPVDHMRMSIGNFFRTREEAEFAVERLKVLAEMRKFAEPFDTKWYGDKCHYFIHYITNIKQLEVHGAAIMRSSELYFKSNERARECIKAVGEDRIKKYYLYLGIE